MLSSTSGLISQKVQANYVGGNVFMDALAAHRRASAGATLQMATGFSTLSSVSPEDEGYAGLVNSPSRAIMHEQNNTIIRLYMLFVPRPETLRNTGSAFVHGFHGMAPTEVAHYNEHVWSADGHPASEFWGARFSSYVETTSEDGSVDKMPQFSMAGRSGQRFPYVARFDVDFVEWTTLDGALPLDRPAENDRRFVGTAAVPSDRDMKVGLRRL
ncbi:hypothetical protein LX32DRAFT_724975 [Colletotrichum zoysiae]|uniref:Ketoreductase (KR) domain-containing protein n=1 Tax=Colletotrichum zoysiae TaxID=1216348 RepID=A0AAD9M6F7_9PEZI|nr:hypothetical protein LX32DRAFT_724975 [Colletotrichum zoysiae]